MSVLPFLRLLLLSFLPPFTSVLSIVVADAAPPSRSLSSSIRNVSAVLRCACVSVTAARRVRRYIVGGVEDDADEVGIGGSEVDSVKGSDGDVVEVFVYVARSSGAVVGVAMVLCSRWYDAPLWQRPSEVESL